MTSEDNSG